MNYKIIIERKEPNPNFEAEYQKWQQESRYSMNKFDEGCPPKELITNALICELTEEQYKAIKAEVFNTFE